MSTLIRAMVVNAKSAELSDKRLQNLLDKKDGENDRMKKINKLIDRLADVQGSRGAGEPTFYSRDLADLRELARDAGVGLGLEDFGVLGSVAESEDSYLRLRTKDGSEADWATERQEVLDALEKKFDRELKTADDGSGMTDLEMNLEMNRFSQKLQDANGSISTIKDLAAALTLGR